MVEDSRKWFDSLSAGRTTISFHPLNHSFSVGRPTPPLLSLTPNENGWASRGVDPLGAERRCPQEDTRTTSASLELKAHIVVSKKYTRTASQTDDWRIYRQPFLVTLKI